MRWKGTLTVVLTFAFLLFSCVPVPCFALCGASMGSACSATAAHGGTATSTGHNAHAASHETQGAHADMAMASSRCGHAHGAAKAERAQLVVGQMSGAGCDHSSLCTPSLQGNEAQAARLAKQGMQAPTLTWTLLDIPWSAQPSLARKERPRPAPAQSLAAIRSTLLRV